MTAFKLSVCWDYRDSFQQLINEITEQVIRDPVGYWDVGWPYAVARTAMYSNISI